MVVDSGILVIRLKVVHTLILATWLVVDYIIELRLEHTITVAVDFETEFCCFFHIISFNYFLFLPRTIDLFVVQILHLLLIFESEGILIGR